jgi:hypothetical protein
MYQRASARFLSRAIHSAYMYLQTNDGQADVYHTSARAPPVAPQPVATAALEGIGPPPLFAVWHRCRAYRRGGPLRPRARPGSAPGPMWASVGSAGSDTTVNLHLVGKPRPYCIIRDDRLLLFSVIIFKNSAVRRKLRLSPRRVVSPKPLWP